MKDKVLLIDAHNALWRASVKYGKPIEHKVCVAKNAFCTNDKKCKHCICIKKHIQEKHCSCGSPWNEEHNKCYGEMYHLVYSFFRNLKPIFEKFQPNKCFFVLEGHPKFRYNLLPEYKANRIIKTGSTGKSQSKIDKFNEQKAVVLDLIKHLPITSCRAAEYEADDLIGELCENMKDEDLTVLSNDSDYIQLLQREYESIRIYNPIKKEYMVAPEYHYIGWKSLNGDKSDNIPKLLTPKKALATIQDPSKLKAFINLNDENNFNFQRNRELIEFRHVPLDNIEIDDGTSNFTLLKKSFSDMKFKSMITESYWNKFVQAFSCITC